MTIIITAAATLLVTILAGLVLDYFRGRKPKIAYSIKNAVPIEMDGKHVGAYVVSIANISRSVVKDVACHIQAQPARLRDGGITTSQGLQYDVKDDPKGLHLSIPYLNGGDELEITIIAESRDEVPEEPDVAVRSPQEFTLVEQQAKSQSFRVGFVSATIVATIVVVIVTNLQFSDLYTAQKDVLIFSASVAELPTSHEVYYFNQGDLAVVYASTTQEASERDKYRKFLRLVLEQAPYMVSSSRANLYYSLGKIDLLMGDSDQAGRDFREAVQRSKSTVMGKTKSEPDVREFLSKQGLL